jgi:hypothetical protein
MRLVALALVLLPGVLVVRAPWTTVAPLSLAFWAVSAWWPPFAGPGRGRVVIACLAVSLPPALLRLLPKHEVPPPPGWRAPPPPPRPLAPGRPSPRFASAASLVVLGTALGLLAPLPLWHHAPGERLAFQTTIARLLLWRDGVPATAEPLLPLEPVGAHAPAIATLAADVAHLTGLDPAAAVLAVLAGGAGLVLVGLFSLHATWAPPWAAATGALVALGVASWPAFLSPWGEGEALVALSFVLPAAALLSGRSSRSSAVAAALLLAAGALAHPLLAAVATVLAASAVLVRARPTAPAGRRVMGTLGLALVLAAPGLLPLARALSLREALAIASADRVPGLAAFAFGLLLAALAPLPFARAARRPAGSGRAALGCVAGLAALLLVLRVHGWIASGQLEERARAALSRAAREAPPLLPVCAPERVRDFVPALAGRPPGEPGAWIPPVYSDEWSRRERRPCAVRLEDLVERR